jgi:CDP-diacylglycerol---glycerol-3-phosphate 3-phosphatidyltransferase
MTPRVDRTTISLLSVGLIAIIGLTAGRRSYGASVNWGFLAGATSTWCWLVFRFARLRQEVSPVGETTAATWVTLARGFLIALVAGQVLVEPRGGRELWLPAVLYTVAALADRIDGALARRAGRTTELGARLDVSTDAVGLLVAPLLGVRAGRLPPWYLALALAYPAFQLALRLRRALGAPVFPERLVPDPRARFFAGVQMTVVACALYPVMPTTFTWTAATVAMAPTLALFACEWRLVARLV